MNLQSNTIYYHQSNIPLTSIILSHTIPKYTQKKPLLNIDELQGDLNDIQKMLNALYWEGYGGLLFLVKDEGIGTVPPFVYVDGQFVFGDVCIARYICMAYGLTQYMCDVVNVCCIG